MSYPIVRGRPLADHKVDRAQMSVQQCIQVIVTNRSRAYPIWLVRLMFYILIYVT